MRVSVKMSGNLRRFLPLGQATLELTLPAGSTVNTVIRQMGVPDGELAVMVVNGELCSETTILHDGDVLELLAAMAGGRQPTCVGRKWFDDVEGR